MQNRHPAFERVTEGLILLFFQTKSLKSAQTQPHKEGWDNVSGFPHFAGRDSRAVLRLVSLLLNAPSPAPQLRIGRGGWRRGDPKTHDAPEYPRVNVVPISSSLGLEEQLNPECRTGQ